MSEVASLDLPPAEKRLDSWKEIAVYLNRGVRTVQRWEQTAGLPVHRLPHEKRGGVYAYSGELDAWWNRGGSRLADEPGVPDMGTGARFLKRHRILVAGTLTLTVGVGFVWWAIGRFLYPILPPVKVVPLTTYPGIESFPAFSPDGGRIAFTWQRDGESSSGVYTQVIGTSGAPLQLARVGTLPAWSPDGQFVSYFRSQTAGIDGDLVLVPALGGPERIIAEISAPSNLPGPFQTWTPDGKWIIVPDRAAPSRPYELTAISMASGGRRRVTNPPSQSYGDSAPAISKDGRTLAFIRSSSLAVDDVFCQSLDLRSDQVPVPHPVTRVGWRMGDLFWDGGGHDILFTGDRSAIRRLWKVSAKGPEQPRLVASISAVGDHVAISPKGDRLAYADIRHHLDIWRQNVPQVGDTALPPVCLISSTRVDANPRVSPDGKRIAFGSDRTGAFEIWVADSDGRHTMQLTALGSYTGTPRWSPDSSRIAFDSRVNGNADIYVVSADGGKVRQLTNEPSDEYMPSWSRDGKWIYFVSNRSGVNQLWRIPADGGPAIQVTRGGAADGMESTDGKSVYFARSFSVTSVWRVPVNGGREEKVFDGLLFPLNFDVASQGIYYFRAPTAGDAARDLVFYSFQSGRTERLARIEKEHDNGLGMSPDGKWFVFAARGALSGDLMMIENFH